MDKAITIIDRYAEAITRSLDLVVYSLEGLYEKTARDNPTIAGLREFMVVSESIALTALHGVMLRFEDAITNLKLSLSQLQRDYLAEHDDSAEFYGVVYTSIGAFLAQARVAYARRLRELIASRAFGFDTYNPEPKIMSRDGRKWDFSEAAYLTSRQSIMDWYNQSLIAYLSSIGSDTFAVESDTQDAMFDLYPIADYPLVAQQLFHPRTEKVVSKYVPS